jgi:hypothetical protein
VNPEFEHLLAEIRVILYHKQATSARTLFLVHAGGSVIAPQPLPPLALVLDEQEPDGIWPLAAHPASVAQALCRHFDLPAGSIEVDAEFTARVDTPGQLLTACIGRLKHTDPPREEFAARGGRFAALTELRGAAPAEMELLRRAYQAILGG